MEGFDQPQGSYDFDDAESLRGRIGARYLHHGDLLTSYGEIKLLHEFKGDNSARFSSGGSTLSLADESEGTWVRAEAGLFSARSGSPGYLAAACVDIGDVGARAACRHRV